MLNELFISGKTGSVFDCHEKVIFFCERDAYPQYDEVGYHSKDSRDELQRATLRVTNSAMRARSKVEAWKPFFDIEFPELSAISLTSDLIEDDDLAYTYAKEKLRACYNALTKASYITDMAASKVLYLKRPKLVSISDSYIREALNVEEPTWKVFSIRNEFYAERGVRVADAVRNVGRANLPLLVEIQEDIASRGFHLSKARIVDILVWVDKAIPVHTSLWKPEAITRNWTSFGTPLQL